MEIFKKLKKSAIGGLVGIVITESLLHLAQSMYGVERVGADLVGYAFGSGIGTAFLAAQQKEIIGLEKIRSGKDVAAAISEYGMCLVNCILPYAIGINMIDAHDWPFYQ